MNKYKLESTIVDAICKGLFQQARLLIKLGHDVNARDSLSRTAIMACALCDDTCWGLSLATTLLQTGKVNTNLRDRVGFTALHMACYYGREGLVSLLLEHQGLHTQLLDIFYNRPCHYAAANGNPEIIKALFHYEHRVLSAATVFLTSNVLGFTPLCLSKLMMRAECYVALKDLVGEIKFPSQKDVFLSRKITDVEFASENPILQKPLDEHFFIKYNPNFKLRQKVKFLSKRFVEYEGTVGSHLDDEASAHTMPKHAMHFSLDFRQWDYVNMPNFVEKTMKLIKNEEEEEEEEEEEDVETAKTDSSINKTEKDENEDAGEHRQSGNLNVSNNAQVDLEVSGSTSKEDEEEEEDCKDVCVKFDPCCEVKVVEEKEDRKVCKRYEMVEWEPVNNYEASFKCEEKVSTESTCETGTNSGVSQLMKEDEEEEEEEEECETKELLTTKTEYQKPLIYHPLVWYYRNTCIQDRMFKKLDCKALKTNVDNKLDGNIMKFIIAVLQELLLPATEKTPPFTAKYDSIIKWTFTYGLVDRGLLGEVKIRGQDVETEQKLWRVYTKAYSKLEFEEGDYSNCAGVEFTWRRSIVRDPPKCYCCFLPVCCVQEEERKRKKVVELKKTLKFLDELYSNQGACLYREPYKLPRVPFEGFEVEEYCCEEPQDLEVNPN